MSSTSHCCTYCGLALDGAAVDASASPAAPSSAAAAPETPLYCCYGCRFAAEVSAAGGEAGQARWAMTRLGLSIFFAMNVMVFTTALWTQDWADPSGGNAGQHAALLYDLFRYLSLLGSLPVLLLLGGPLLESALEGAAAGRWSTDLLLVAGVVASYALSAWGVFTDAGHVYFEVGVVVLVCVTLGRWLEATGRLKTTAALDALARLLPRDVRVLRAGGEETISLDQLAAGDLFRVVAGERIATDGVVAAHRAAVDQQLVTGESQPRVVEAGDLVYGGTLNLDGDLQIRAAAPASQGSLQRLVDAVRRAAREKGEYERAADQVSRWFLPLVMAAAALALILSSLQGKPHEGILHAMAVVVIACPCALAIATPLAIWTALGRAAEWQTLVRNGDALTRLAEVRVLALDKTGTLTTGAPRLAHTCLAADADAAATNALARRLAAGSNHPLSRTLCEELDSEVQEAEGAAIITLPGRGLATTLADGTLCHLGSLRLMDEAGHRCPPSLRDDLDAAIEAGAPLTCLGICGEIRAVYLFEEELRAGADELLDWARASSLHVCVLTGDYAERAESLQRRLNVPVLANLLPEDKQQALAELRARHGPVAMLGDGANDAPALAAADVGIALGCGADVSRQSADVCLLGSDLATVPKIVALARECVTTIRTNLVWAFAYNAVGIGLALFGVLHPILAAVAMTASSLLVVTNSLRLAAPVEEFAASTWDGPEPLQDEDAVGIETMLPRQHLAAVVVSARNDKLEPAGK